MAKAKQIAGLDCQMRASDGISLILRARLEEMCAFRASALDWSSIEGVHAMRVASRRLRSAIKDFSPYLRRRKLRQAREDLRGVAHSLGAVRDQDVALVALEKLGAAAPPELSAGIEQFASARQRKRYEARAHLEDALTEGALEKLRLEFKDALEESSKVEHTSREGRDGQEVTEEIKLDQVAREILDERQRDIQELSTSLFQPFEPEPLHRMRIAAKRLRYAMELFTPCLGDELKPFCKEIARMQDSLGELHDCDVWIAEIGAALRDGSEDGSSSEYDALLWLLDYFVKERTAHFHAAFGRWREWKATGFQAQLTAAIYNRPHAAEQPAQPSADAQAEAQITSHENQ